MTTAARLQLITHTDGADASIQDNMLVLSVLYQYAGCNEGVVGTHVLTIDQVL
jgi:hypothetical protein